MLTVGFKQKLLMEISMSSQLLANLLLVPHFPQAFFSLVRRHFMAFALFSTWHTRLLG